MQFRFSLTRVWYTCGGTIVLGHATRQLHRTLLVFLMRTNRWRWFKLWMCIWVNYSSKFLRVCAIYPFFLHCLWSVPVSALFQNLAILSPSFDASSPEVSIPSCQACPDFDIKAKPSNSLSSSFLTDVAVCHQTFRAQWETLALNLTYKTFFS